MGTRASFWIGNPTDLENREWLGCIAWDGHPENMSCSSSEESFRGFVAGLSTREDFATPDKGWPFPWADDIFVTDFTYAFFDGKVMAACFHCGFVPLEEAQKDDFEWPDKDTLPKGIPAPKPYDRSQPDSIMIISLGPKGVEIQ